MDEFDVEVLRRKGIEIERQAREILINKLQLDDFDESSNQGKILIECSKGTYVRTLIHDMGQNLGCGATMIELQRLSSNGFKIDESYTLEEIIEYRNSTLFLKIEDIMNVNGIGQTTFDKIKGNITI